MDAGGGGEEGEAEDQDPNDFNDTDLPSHTPRTFTGTKNCKINLLLTNARSLAPKIESFVRNVEEREIDLSVVTESWFRGGNEQAETLQDLELGSGLGVIYKNRRRSGQPNRLLAHGGVLIAFRTKTGSFKERKIAGNVFEMVAAEGKIEGIQRKIVVYAVYLPPQMRKENVDRQCEALSNDIARAKSTYDNPIIVIMGDINRKNFGEAYSNFVDIREIQSGPTRGRERLDRCFTNISQTETEVVPPLTNRDGVASDHACLLIRAAIERKKPFEYVKIKARKRTQKGFAAFGEELAEYQWENILTGSADEMVEVMHGLMDSMMDKHFPYRTHKRRSNSDPWITNGIRARLKKERKMFHERGKDVRWHEHKRETLTRIKQKKIEFVERAAEEGPRAFFSAVKGMCSADGQQRWDVMSLFPEGNKEKAAEEIMGYFSEVAGSFEPVEQGAAIETDFRTLHDHEVEVRIRKAKKPNSGLPGDIFPELLTEYAKELAAPLRIIFNKILKNATWPRQWKNEFITVIPKKQKPESLAQCRNISCTNFWSKLLEAIVLERLKSEIEPDPVQYGGLKGCSTGHFLAEVWDTVLTTLDNPSNAVNLCSIDFSKAFNRMNHDECLKQLRKLGASETSIALVRSFLSQRRMNLRLGGETFPGPLLNGGSPQGSVLGCYLYCATTQQLGPEMIPAHPSELMGSSLGSLPPSPPPPTETRTEDECESPVGAFRALSPSSHTACANCTQT